MWSFPRHPRVVARGIAARVAPAALAVSVLFAPAAAADSAHGAQGSSFNRSGSDPALERDDRGMSVFVPERSRTPGGFLYEAPYEMPQARPLTDNWSYRLSAEVGAAHDSGGAPRIRNYGDFRSGGVLNFFSLGLEQAGSPRYLDVTAGAVGRDDQYYRVTFGHHGAFRTRLHFSEIPKEFTDRARTVFLGAGSGSLTLPAGFAPGAGTPAQVTAALDAAPFFSLGYTRKNAGLDFDATPADDWRVYARYDRERKNGTRPFGGASNYPGAPLAETIEPLDYKTHTVAAGVQWTGPARQANLSYAGSWFRNGIDTLTWENPLNVGDPAVLQRGRMDLYPDNASHNLKLDLGAALPMRGRLTGGASWTRMTQDDALIAPTVNSGFVGATDLANWNTTAALSQRSAGARVDTRLFHLGASFAPLRDLSLQARWRRLDEDNKTRYTAFNPLTGEYGYLGLDGANDSNIAPGLFRVPVRNIPFERRRDNYGVEGDYRLLRRTSLTFGYEREDNRHAQREFAETREDRFRLALNNRDLPWATARLAWEHAKRSGDTYNFNPNAAYYTAAPLIVAPPTLANLRKHDIADRAQDVVSARVNFIVARDMDLAVTGRYLDNDYSAAYGRLGERVSALNVEWNWQPRPGASAWAHAGLERRKNRMAQINDDPGGWGTGDPSAGGAAYPLANRWEEESRDDSRTLGLGFRFAFPRATLESGYTWVHSPYRTRYSYASAGALASGAAADAAGGMPDILFRQETLETSLRIAIDRSTALRLFHRYERARFEDWHYDGLPLVMGFGEAVFLGAGPRNYTANVFGVFLQYTPGKRAQERK